MAIDDFRVHELTCPHIFKLHGDKALAFADPRLLRWLSWFRIEIDRPVTINTYGLGGEGTFTQRGYRCNLCQLVVDKSKRGILYASAHTRFQAVDFSVRDMLDEEVRQWIERHKSQMPVNIRIENGTLGWVHVDVCNDTYQKVIYFNG